MKFGMADGRLIMPPMGFVILTHTRPRQALRLARALGAQFGQPPIVIHHDFDQTPLDSAPFPAGVQFVRPHVRTAWGAPTLNDAALAGFRLLLAGGGADWIALLSGADYPIKS